MDIPTFYPGETLSSEKLNRLADALRELADECRANRITDVANGTFERSSAGTTLAFPTQQKKRAARQVDEYVPPFKVTIDGDGQIRVAPGTSYSLTAQTSGFFQLAATYAWPELTFRPGSAKAGGGVTITDPYPDGTIEALDDLRLKHPSAIVIAEFVDYGDGLKVKQYLRSDAYHVRASPEVSDTPA